MYLRFCINATVSVPNTSLAMLSVSQKRTREPSCEPSPEPSPETGRKPITFLDVLIVAFQQRPWIMHYVANILVFVSRAVRRELRNNGQSLSLVLARRYTEEYDLAVVLTRFLKEWASQVTVFDLSKQRLTVAGGIVQMLRRLPRLEHLALRFNRTEGFFVDLENTRFRNLRVFDVRQCRFEAHELRSLFDSLSECKELQQVMFGNSNLDGHCGDLADVFRRSTALTHVSFDNCFRMPNVLGIREIAFALSTSLESFVLGNHQGFNHMDYEYLLDKLAACRNLVTVYLEHAIQSDANSRKKRLFRARLGELRPVQVLSLNHSELYNEGVYGSPTLWITLSTMTNLRKLSLDHCNIYFAWFADDLRKLPNLEELSLKGNRIPRKHARPIAESWRPMDGHGSFWPSLRVLNLAYNHLGIKSAVEFMAEVYHMPAMREIGLRNTVHEELDMDQLSDAVRERDLNFGVQRVPNKGRVVRAGDYLLEYNM
jgi:hypothetical protein